MSIVDLSHTLSPDMPVYPGTEQPQFTTSSSLENDGFFEKKITMSSHTGTHVDAPAHMIKDAKTLDQLGIDHFHGPALLLNVENEAIIDVAFLEAYEKKIENVNFVLFHTGWSKYWGIDTYFSDYKTLTVEAAQWLAQFQLKGIGLDTISADVADSREYPVHRAFLGKDIVIIENLTNLSSLPHSHFIFSCFPIKFGHADGSPVRAVAYVS